MRMWVYVVRRVVLVIPVIIGVMTVLFVLISALPETERACSFYPPSGKLSPCTTATPCPTNPSQLCSNPVYEQAVQALGLNQPIFVQWAIYVGNALAFNWGYVAQGTALGTGETGSGLPALAGHSVASVLSEFLPYSLELILLTFAITLLVVIPLQNRATAYPGHAADRTARALTLPGYGIALFVLGILLLDGVTLALGGPGAPSTSCGGTSTVFLDFYGSWPQPPCTPLYGTTNLGPVGFPNWLSIGYISTPTGFPTVDAAIHGQYWLALDTVLRMVLPALLLALVAIAVVFRFVRYTSSEQMVGRYLRGARARGLPESRVIGRQAGRHTLSAILPALVPALLLVLAWLSVAEIFFNLWGVGRIFADSVVGGPRDWDIGTLFGVTLLLALAVVALGVVTDVLRAYLDPRLRVA